VATPPRDLREWIALLEREGELHRISAEADPDLEITEITDRVVKAGGPALLFENPKGSQHPLLINQFGTERRMCMALGVETLDDAAAKLGDILDMQPPVGIREKVKGLIKLVKANHPYKVPEVISLRIKEGNRDYLRWIADSLGTPRKKQRIPKGKSK